MVNKNDIGLSRANKAASGCGAAVTIHPESGHGGVFQHRAAFVRAVLDFLAD